MTLDDTKTRIMLATMKAVRQYGLEGVRIQNVSELAGITPGAIYRYFDSKDQMIAECFTYVDKQAAAIFGTQFEPRRQSRGQQGKGAKMGNRDIILEDAQCLFAFLAYAEEGPESADTILAMGSQDLPRPMYSIKLSAGRTTLQLTSGHCFIPVAQARLAM